MKSSRQKDGSVSTILASGFIILLICILICIIHVADIRRTFLDNARENLLAHMNVGVSYLNEEIGIQQEITKSYAEEIAKIIRGSAGNPKEELISALQKAGIGNPEYDFLYVTGQGEIFYQGGMIQNDNVVADITQLRGYQAGYTCITTKYSNEGNEETAFLVRILPIKDEDGNNIGYFVTRRAVDQVFSATVFDYLNELGVCCLMNSGGEVMATNEEYEKVFGEESNYYIALMDHSDASGKSERTIRNIKNKITGIPSNFFEFTAINGETTFVSYQLLESTVDVYFTVCYDDGILDDMIQPVLFRSFLECMFITIFLIGLLAYVWISGRTANGTIERLVFEDEVTGGKNFNFFRQKSVEIINENRETPFLIYRFDILNFRYINEAYGHVKADAILRACVQEYVHYFGNKELCVRINSDQFLAIAVNDASINQRIQNYMDAVGEAARAEGVRYPIRFKMGIYQIRKDDKDIDVMIDHANAARKSLSGDEKILEATYSENIVSSMRKIDAIESEMQAALANGEFQVYLQPKWNIKKNRVAGAEALVRWVKKDGTMIFPNDFIPVFEKNGFIEKLDFYMLEQLCIKMYEMEKQKDKYHIYPVSINQSRLLINNPDYVKNIEKILNKYDVAVEKLELEITETVFFSERTKMIDVMNQLKDLGLTLAMDDFGSGYSSLNVLKDIPFDILKIDREFFSESVTSESSILIMQKIIEMAKGLGIDVICEGVETAEQVEVLQKIGCNMVQGYFYAKPMPMEEFVQKYSLIKETDDEIEDDDAVDQEEKEDELPN